MGMISAQSGTWLPERPADPDWSEGERRAIGEDRLDGAAPGPSSRLSTRARFPTTSTTIPTPITGFCAAPTRSIAVPTARGS